MFELNRKQSDRADFPIQSSAMKVAIELDFGDVLVPKEAQRRLAFEHLRRLVLSSTEDDLTALGMTTPVRSFEAEDNRLPVVRSFSQNQWNKPDGLDMRIVKSAHRVILEVAKRGQTGREVLASDLVGSVGLSAPTLGRLLRDEEEASQYLRQYVSIRPHGRTRALDLTPEGRVLASRIRANVVPS